MSDVLSEVQVCRNWHGRRISRYQHNWVPGVNRLTPTHLAIVRKNRNERNHDPLIQFPGDPNPTPEQFAAAGLPVVAELQPPNPYAGMTKAQLLKAATVAGIELDKNLNRDALQAALEAALAAKAAAG